MKKSTIVFLDYDGVIIDAGSRIVEGSRQGFNRVSLKLIERLQEQFGFLVVCSSRAHAKTTWEEQWAPLAKYDSTLKFYQDDTRPMSWRTWPSRKVCKSKPDKTYDYRGWFVYEWLLEHGYDPESDNYIMLDDDSDYYPICESRFVQVINGEHYGGFGFKHFLDLREKLIELQGDTNEKVN